MLILAINLPLLTPYGLRLTEHILLYSCLTLAWIILYKFLGLFFLGITGVVGLSTYIVSILHESLFFVTPLDMFVSTILVGLILAPLTYLILRTSGGYFALLTLGLNLIVPLITASLDFSYFRVAARYLNININLFFTHLILLVLFFAISLLYLYLCDKTNLRYTLLLIKKGKYVAEQFGIDYHRYRFTVVLILLFFISSMGVVHSAYLTRVDPQIIFPSELTLLPITAGLLCIIRTRGPAFIDLGTTILIPLANLLLGVTAPAFVEILLGILIFGTLVILIKKALMYA